MARIDYDQVATHYDRARGMPLEDILAWRYAVAPYVAEAPERCVLDVGAGTGLFALAFAEWFDVPVVAVEPSAAMLEKARAQRAHPRITYVEGDAEDLAVERGSAGLAWLSTVVHHVPDLAVCARALRTALRPRGPVLIRGAFPGRLDDITLFRFFPTGRKVIDTYPTVEQTAAAFASAGFTIESLTSVPQISARSMRTFLDSVRLRADTVLRGISDDDFAAGLVALERAVAEQQEERPVVDRLDLLVLR